MIEVETSFTWLPGTYYVYEHVKKSDGTVFYVGKGTGDRLKSLDGRNNYWKNIKNKHGVLARVVACNLNEHEALLLEHRLILAYGRRDLNTGPLVNLTEGFDGVRGYVFTDQHRLKISKAGIGRRHSDAHRAHMSALMMGRVITQEARDKIAAARRGKKLSHEHRQQLCRSNSTKRSVICIETGVIYPSTQAAALAVAGSSSTISKCCYGKRKTHKGYRWSFAHNASDLNADNRA